MSSIKSIHVIVAPFPDPASRQIKVDYRIETGSGGIFCLREFFHEDAFVSYYDRIMDSLKRKIKDKILETRQ